MRFNRLFLFALALTILAASNGNADSRVIVILKAKPRLQTLEHASVIRAMQETNRSAMASVLRSENITAQNVRELWLVRGFATTASPETIRRLENHSGVFKVYENKKIQLPKVKFEEVPPEGEYTYGLQKIGIPDLRTAFPELTGAGIVAGVLDTGIDVTHPDLGGRLLAFHDFANGRAESYDDHGHGTHVSGTIAGGNSSGTQIGVAPETKLVVGKVFDAYGSGTTEGILAGMQWMADPDGNPDTTEDVPTVVNNSWGGSGYADETDPFYLAVDSWRKLNIFPSFAAGNEGPDSATISSPGAFPIAFAVGAIDASSVIASFSSVGPGQMTVAGELRDFPKPDVCAPGVKVYSSLPKGKYASWSGTSMATPHVTGAVVLLRQKFPTKSIGEIATLLTQAAGDLGEAGFDYQYGNGLIDVLQATTKAEGVFVSRHGF